MHEGAELADCLFVPTEGKLRIESKALGLVLELARARGLTGEQAVRAAIAEGFPTPKAQRLLENLRRLLCAACREQAARLGDGGGEAGEVERARLEREEIPARTSLQRGGLRAKRLAEPRDVHLKALCGLLRRLVRPQLVHQALSRDDLVRACQQEGEKRPLLARREPHRASVDERLHRPEDAKLD